MWGLGGGDSKEGWVAAGQVAEVKRPRQESAEIIHLVTSLNSPIFDEYPTQSAKVLALP